MPEWQALALDHIVEYISEGIIVDDSDIPHFHDPNPVFKDRKDIHVTNEINRLIDNGVLEETSVPPKCISPVYTVPKRQKNKHRLITNLKRLNSLIPAAPHFRNEDIGTVCDLIKPGDYLTKIDVKDGFFHIPIEKQSQRLFGIFWKSKYYVYKSLPFGYSWSPYYFHKCFRPVLQRLRELGVRLVTFVDDILIMASKSDIAGHTQMVLDALSELGWRVNLEKSQLDPAQEVTFIGYSIRTWGERVVIKVPGDRIRKAKKDIRRVLSGTYVKARQLARVTGQLISMSKAILPAKLLLRNAYRLLKSRDSWESELVVDGPTRADLEWWLSALTTWNGIHVCNREIDCQMSTDASKTGWGADLNGQLASGYWDRDMANMSSNYREIQAVFLAICSSRKELTGKHVQVLSDNVSTVAYLNHMGGPSRDLTEIASDIWDLALGRSIHISARYLAGRSNDIADRMSRLNPRHEWQLHPGLFRMLESTWGPHTVDRFASETNYQLPRYNSRYMDPYAEAVDAFAQQNWGAENNYVNAPFRLIPDVLQIIRTQRADATIIAPMWRAQPWFQDLIELSVCSPLRLPRNHKTYIAAGHQPEPCRNRRWNIYAWRISGKRTY